MIEMRWYVPVVGEKVLQYRQKLFQGWSEWKTVPMESERNPDFP